MTLYHGDCLEVMRTMPDCSVDSVVTDPPYGLSFMGKRWDYDVPSTEIWRECLRVLKPGGHLLAFAGTRTQHRMAVNIEDAGFEIRDMIAWAYGSGFPKSMDISKAIDKAAGAEREVIGENPWNHVRNHNPEKWDGATRTGKGKYGSTGSGASNITAPATPEAKQWKGWGTALKPALEPITVARKPFKGTVAQNVLEHGTGALNIDGCRVDAEQRPQIVSDRRLDHNAYGPGLGGSRSDGTTTLGRWPANLIHDGSEEVVELFPRSEGMKRGTLRRGAMTGLAMGAHGIYGEMQPMEVQAGYGDSGSAARFFQQCKGGYAELWQDLNLPPESASTADRSSSQQRAAAVSALALAVSSVLPGVTQSSVQMAPSTTATGSELKLIAESVTQAILSIAPRFWHESQPAKLSLTSSPVSVVVQREPTGITTITASHWKSDGSADPATFVITPMNLEHGERDYAARFRYCTKASKADREDGNVHPTVKPVELMAYLCRLVTPPGGIVLDPFMGSGSTIKAALSEGFCAIGIERDPSYYAIAERRLNSAQLGLPMELEP